MLMASIICFTSPLALLYAFRARRKAQQRELARGGLALSLIVFFFFAMLMMGAILDLKDALCR